MREEPPHGIGRDAAEGVDARRHWGGFIVSGALAFTVDFAVMEVCVRMLGLPPLLARVIGIGFAMVAAWLSHRRLTFALTTRPSLGELGRYVLAASATALINYAVFAAVLLAWPSVDRLIALVAATFLATIFSYLSMRYGVFRRT